MENSEGPLFLTIFIQHSQQRSLFSMEVCEGEGVDEAELRSALRKRQVVKSRRVFCQIAVKKMGYSGADVARFLGINTSAVNRLAVSDELSEVEKYI